MDDFDIARGVCDAFLALMDGAGHYPMTRGDIIDAIKDGARAAVAAYLDKQIDPTQEPTVTVDRVAAILKISRASAYAAVASGEIPSIRINRRILVPTAKLLEMLGVTS